MEVRVKVYAKVRKMENTTPKISHTLFLDFVKWAQRLSGMRGSMKFMML